MNERAFDRMARLWGTSTDRRRALQLIGAGVIAGSWLRRSKTAAAQTSAGQIACIQDADCQDADPDPCTGATCQEGFCTFFIVSCIPGTICCGNGECCPSRRPEAARRTPTACGSVAIPAGEPRAQMAPVSRSG